MGRSVESPQTKQGGMQSPVSLRLTSALSFGTTTAALWIAAGLLTAGAGSPSRGEWGTPAGRR